MAAIVAIDAAIFFHASSSLPTTTPYWSGAAWANTTGWTEITERNDISISISVDVAEHKPFVTSLAAAWVGKARTWMNWSGSLAGYYDDADDTIFTTMKSGDEIYLLVFDSRRTATVTTPKYWFGKALLTSVDHSVGSEDFSTLDVDFEGSGILYRSALS